MAKKLKEIEIVETAYIKLPAEPSVSPLTLQLTPKEEEHPVTPDFTAHQGYLDAAPGGIDARYSWTQTGGSGSNVRIIDIEGAWRFTHEDLRQNTGGVVGGGSIYRCRMDKSWNCSNG